MNIIIVHKDIPEELLNATFIIIMPIFGPTPGNEIKSFKLEGDIEFKNVSLTYDDTKIKALKNINFSIKKVYKIF